LVNLMHLDLVLAESLAYPLLHHLVLSSGTQITISSAMLYTHKPRF
jgi:hypothetical protein